MDWRGNSPSGSSNGSTATESGVPGGVIVSLWIAFRIVDREIPRWVPSFRVIPKSSRPYLLMKGVIGPVHPANLPRVQGTTRTGVPSGWNS